MYNLKKRKTIPFIKINSQRFSGTYLRVFVNAFIPKCNLSFIMDAGIDGNKT